MVPADIVAIFFHKMFLLDLLRDTKWDTIAVRSLLPWDTRHHLVLRSEWRTTTLNDSGWSWPAVSIRKHYSHVTNKVLPCHKLVRDVNMDINVNYIYFDGNKIIPTIYWLSANFFNVRGRRWHVFYQIHDFFVLFQKTGLGGARQNIYLFYVQKTQIDGPEDTSRKMPTTRKYILIVNDNKIGTGVCTTPLILII